MTDLALQLIEKEKRERSGYLDLGNCGLTEFPDLTGMDWVETLILSDWWGEFDVLRNEWEYFISQNKGLPNQLENTPSTHPQFPPLKKLIVQNLGISDAVFLEKLTNLSAISISYNQISDAGFLEKLTNLTSLNIRSNRISEAGFLEKLTNLTSLDISHNQISDARVLEKLTNLTSLNISSNKINDAKGLENLTNLTSLSISDNQISNAGFLEKLTNLTSLDISRNKISDAGFLEKLTNLTSLDIWHNKISDAGFLEKLTNLTSLDISFNQISDARALEKLTNLTSLDISFNSISEADFLEKLTNLTSLDTSSNTISDNQISNAGFLEKLTNLTSLKISSNTFSDAGVLEKLTNLTLLDISSNKISNAGFLEKLTNLTSLDISSNKISNAGFLEKLTNLTSLDISSNKISNAGFLEKLTNLTSLNIRNNKISDLSPILHLVRNGIPVELGDIGFGKILVKNNPLTTPPIEVVKRGNEAILDFFSELEKQGSEQLYEAKMLIIGEGGSGKTTLYRKLQGNDSMPDEAETTRGIDIHALKFKSKAGREFTMHIWDFGGQEIYHATHQFFLTKRSLYVLVTDNRKEENQDYWLQVQKLYGESSPMLIVQNEKGGRKKELPVNEIRASFPNVQKDIIALDLSLAKQEDQLQLENLKIFLEAKIQELPHVGDTLPKQWAVIRRRIEDLTLQKAYISQDKYFALCSENGLPEEDRALRLSEYLHDLGVFLHFHDDVLLSRTLFLQNDWVTDAVFALIDGLSSHQFEERWKFDEKTANSIWCQANHDRRYKGKVAELIALLEKFELCYEVSRKEWLVPQLLPGTRPKETVDATFKREHALQLRFEYGFMPKGLLSRLMVRMHRYVAGEGLIWRSGMVLFHPTYQSQAELVETYGDRNIRVWVKGGRVKEFASLIIDEINLLNATFGDNLEVTTFLPCACSVCRYHEEPHFFDLKQLRERSEIGKPTIECQRKPYENVSVQALIENVFVTVKKSEPLKVFISYSKEDEAHKEALLTHLKPLQRKEELITWNDRHLLPGEDWDARIRHELTVADIVLVLLSPDALATDYIWDIEIKQAIAQSNSGKSAVIPVIVRPCDWQGSPLARISALPLKAQPVTMFENNDEAWQQVMAGVREVVERVKAWR